MDLFCVKIVQRGVRCGISMHQMGITSAVVKFGIHTHLWSASRRSCPVTGLDVIDGCVCVSVSFHAIVQSLQVLFVCFGVLSDLI